MKLIKKIKGSMTPLKLAFVIALGFHLSLFSFLPSIIGAQELKEEAVGSQSITFRMAQTAQASAPQSEKSKNLKKEKKNQTSKPDPEEVKSEPKKEERIKPKEKEVKKKEIKKEPKEEVKKIEKEPKKERSKKQQEKEETIKKSTPQQKKTKEKKELKEEVKKKIEKEKNKKTKPKKNQDKEETKVEEQKIRKEVKNQEKIEEKKPVTEKTEQKQSNQQLTKQSKNNKSTQRVDLTKGTSKAGITPPSLRHYQKPIYPARMRRREIEGTVILRILIDTRGNIDKIQVKQSSGYKQFDEAAKRTAKKWNFNPTRKEGKKVEAWIAVPIRFRLN